MYRRLSRFALAGIMGMVPVWLVASTRAPVSQPPAPATQTIDLVALWRSGKLRPVNRAVEAVPDRPDALRLTKREGPGVAWIEGTALSEGTIAFEVRGKDVFQESFPGMAFHRKNDTTYEAVYVRPFNFRTSDSVRHGHAVQYMVAPDFDWPRLREQFPEEFEHSVDATVSPTDWVPVRIAISTTRVRVFVGRGTAPTLDVRRLGGLTQGNIGLWAGNNSDGDFAKLTITPDR